MGTNYILLILLSNWEFEKIVFFYEIDNNLKVLI